VRIITIQKKTKKKVSVANMEIAYIVSGLEMSMTVVVNEMESHEKNGWTVLPLISCKTNTYLSPKISKLRTIS
jgi:hypothetical protein